MRILSVSLTNFSSYKELAFDFTDQGLTLIQGPTGSGKSTLMDAVPWVLFGSTAKGGPVSDVISWPGDDVATGTVWLENLVGETLVVHRSRGSKAKDNDLYISVADDSPPVRGKDLNDTQKIINGILGIDCDLYLAASYFHEFSQTAQFFTTTPKNRRAICEQLVDLSLAIKLTPKIKESQKGLLAVFGKTTSQINATTTQIKFLQLKQVTEQNRLEKWYEEQDYKRGLLETKMLGFEDNKTKSIESLIEREKNFYAEHAKRHVQMCTATVCSECGALKKPQKSKPAEIPPSPYTDMIEQEKRNENTYIQQLKELNQELNPYLAGVTDFSSETSELQLKLVLQEEDAEKLNEQTEDLELLQDVVADWRSTSIKNTIQFVEEQTNKLLEKHFDSECKVNFTVEDSDKLDVTIHKDGNICNYSQLSKGQRCLLKLCFGVSVMRGVANHHGVSFKQVFFDEALDGLDEQMKAKAYGLLSTLIEEYESIFVVEHSEGLKQLFANKFSVQLINGISQIEQA